MMRYILVVVAGVVAGMMSVRAAQVSPSGLFAGTWKLNAAKSIYEGTEPPESLMINVEDGGEGLVVSRSEAVLPDGNRTQTSTAFKCDGKDYPFSLGQGSAVPLLIAALRRRL